MKTITKAVLVAATMFSPIHALACECTQSSIKELIEREDRVVLAEAKTKSWTMLTNYVKYRFKILRTLKGIERNRMTIFSAKHSCGANYKLGEAYLMVVQKEGSKFVSHQCYYWPADSSYSKEVLGADVK